MATIAVSGAIAVDGSTLSLRPTPVALARDISVPGDPTRTEFFQSLGGRLGTVWEVDGVAHVTGLFLATRNRLDIQYGDGRSETLVLGGTGRVALSSRSSDGEAACTLWYPAGHRFSAEERRAALSDYARRLGVAGLPRRAARQEDLCAAAMADMESEGDMAAGGAPDMLSLFGLADDARLWAGFEYFYAGFLAPHEGGYVANDGNGSPANFGINQGGNPDIDVVKLTQGEAEKILYDRYWVASGAGRLPSALAAVHGDTAINLGLAVASQLLAQSNGDPQKYLDLRDARYRAIAQSNSDRAGYLPIWLARNEDLRRFIAAETDGNVVTAGFSGSPKADWENSP
jgi:hypothetical protein